MLLCFATSCSQIVKLVPVEVDKTLGSQFAEQMEVMPAMGGTMLPEKGNEALYGYVNQIKNQILSSSAIVYKSDFPYQLKIIKEDSVRNAFCIAGGYIYVYTGIIKFLDNEAELAGVLAHEIAHAELRHTTLRLLSEYGISISIALVLGTDPGMLVQIGKQLLGLTFSRADEADADALAVRYLCDTPYDPRAVGGFFKKMLAENKDARVPEFLSTHPSSENRVSDIEDAWRKNGARTGNLFTKRHLDAKKILN